MKTRTQSRPRRATPSAYALAIVLVFTGISLALLASSLNWCSTNSGLNQRNNEYFRTVAAAEAATEKALSRMTRDFRNGGESLVFASLANYRSDVPVYAENMYWADYQFTDGAGGGNLNHIARLSAASYVPLQSQYQGLYGLAATYRILSNAKNTKSDFGIVGAVNQDIQLATIPIFQFAIWYAIDLEINPGPNMIVTGRVHSNGDLFLEPVNELTFNSDVTSAGQIYHQKKPGDPVVRNSGYDITYQAEHDAGVSSMTLPVGADNSPAAVHAIVEVPPAGEDPNSPLGQERFYNKADLVIIVDSSGITVRSGKFDHFSTTLSPSEASVFLDTTSSFYNKREQKTVSAINLNVGKLKSWSGTNNSLRPLLGRDVRSVYVADQRILGSTFESGVRLVNGQTLPSLGLTVSTPNPLYVQGNYNCPTSALGTSDTSQTKPAALIGDAITVLSTAWSDANAGASLSQRNANNTTVNAAFLAGIVPTTPGIYSGGVENFPRFLETWTGKSFTYNGSMVVMYHSAIATAPWGGGDVYVPPNRKWAFDLNFLDATKLPPDTPSVRAVIRGVWRTVKAGTTSF